VSEALAPLLERFRNALRSTELARRARGAPRGAGRWWRRSTVCDAFLAIDAESGRVVDANRPPARCSASATRARRGGERLHRSSRPGGLGDGARAMTEAPSCGASMPPARRQRRAIAVDCTATRFATRDRAGLIGLAVG
jgi:hypothetical protein